MRQIIVLCVLALGIGVAATAAAEPYPANVRDSFMNECQAKATEAHCACVLTSLESNVPVAQMLSGQVTDEQIDGFVNACLTETQIPANEWPRELEMAFIDGCRADLEDAICRCLVGKLEGEVEFQSLMAGQLDQTAVEKHVAACTAEQNQPAPAEDGAQPPAEGGAAPAPAPAEQPQ